MMKFRLFASALLVALSVSTFAAEDLTCSGFVKINNNNSCSYGSTFTWTGKNANTMKLFEIARGEGDNLSQYSALKLTPTKALNYGQSNFSLRILFIGKNLSNSSDSTYVTKYFGNIDGNEKTIDLTEFTQIQLDSVSLIAIGGNCDSASVVIDPSSIKLIKKSDASEVVCSGIEKRNGNNNCSFKEDCFSWNASTSNNMTIFSFEAGTLSNYEKLTFTTSDLWGGGSYRVLFIYGSENKTKSFYSAGEKTIDLASDLDGLDLSTVTSIRFAGNSAKGSLTILPSSIVLHAKNTTPSTIDDVRTATKAVKIIENGQVFILRDGVRYNTLGQAVK